MLISKRNMSNNILISFFLFVLLLISLLVSLESEFFVLFSVAAFTFCCIVVLSLFSGALDWRGTLFLFIVFASFQFLAIIFPSFFGVFPHNRFFYDRSEAEFYFIYYLLVFLLGFVILVTGYFLGKKIKITKKGLKCNNIPLLICFIPFAISLLGFYKIFTAGGGFFSTIIIMGSINLLLSDLAFFVSISKIGYISCCLLVIVGKYRSCGVIFIVLTVFNAAIGERGALLFSGIIPVLITYRLSHGKIPKKYISIGLTLFLVYYLGIGAIRSVQQDIHKPNVAPIDVVLNVFTKTEHHINAAATIKMADKEGLYLGETLYNLIYVPIPRSIWSQKPVTSESAIVGMQLKKINDPTGAGLPPGLIAYSYLQFGMIGVCVFTFLSGIVAGVSEKYFLNVKNSFNIILYSQSQALFVQLISTEVQVKFLMNLLVVLIITFLSMLIDTSKE